MFRKNKTTIKTTVAVIALLLVALLMRYVPVGESMLLAAIVTTIRNGIHISLLVVWCISLYRRLMNPQIRHILVCTGALMALWLIAKTVKYEFLNQVFSSKDLSEDVQNKIAYAGIQALRGEDITI